MPPRKRCSIPVKDCGPPAKRNFDVSDMSSDSNDSCSDPVFAEYIDSVKVSLKTAQIHNHNDTGNL